MTPKIAIIILNWNGWKETIECLESLYNIDYPKYDVILVDNGSSDDSLEKIRNYALSNNKNSIKILEFFKKEAENIQEQNFTFENRSSTEKMTIIKNRKNYGFAEGNNIGMQYALKTLLPDYLLFLNNDTIVDEKLLSEMVKIGESQEAIGIIGPKTYYYDYNGSKNVINFAGGKFSIWKGKPYHIGIGETDISQYDDVKEVDYVEGSCLLIKKELVEKIKLMNPFLFGWEEIDWSLKAKKMGFKCFYVPDAKIWHKIGASMGGKFSFFHLYYFVRSCLIVMTENAKWYHLITFLPFFVSSILYRIFSIVKNENNIKSIFYSLKVIIKAFFDIKKVKSKKLEFKLIDKDKF